MSDPANPAKERRRFVASPPAAPSAVSLAPPPGVDAPDAADAELPVLHHVVDAQDGAADFFAELHEELNAAFTERFQSELAAILQAAQARLAAEIQASAAGIAEQTCRSLLLRQQASAERAADPPPTLP